MRSETDTKYRNSIHSRLTLLLCLWILDKIIMFIMLWCTN